MYRPKCDDEMGSASTDYLTSAEITLNSIGEDSVAEPGFLADGADDPLSELFKAWRVAGKLPSHHANSQDETDKENICITL